MSYNCVKCGKVIKDEEQYVKHLIGHSISGSFSDRTLKKAEIRRIYKEEQPDLNDLVDLPEEEEVDVLDDIEEGIADDYPLDEDE